MVGPEKLLGRMFNKCLGEKYGYLTEYLNEEKEVKHKGVGKKSAIDNISSKSTNGLKTGVVESPVSILHALDSCESFDTSVLLAELKPRIIIMYDCDMTFVMQVEVYQAINPGLHTRVYFILYRGSVEEQAYLTTLRGRRKLMKVSLKLSQKW